MTTSTGISRHSARLRISNEELEAVHLRHHEIEHDDVGPRLASRASAIRPFSASRHLPPVLLEREPHATPHRLVVVDQQDLAADRRRRCCRSTSASLSRSTGLTM